MLTFLELPTLGQDMVKSGHLSGEKQRRQNWSLDRVLSYHCAHIFILLKPESERGDTALTHRYQYTLSPDGREDSILLCHSPIGSNSKFELRTIQNNRRLTSDSIDKRNSTREKQRRISIHYITECDMRMGFDRVNLYFD